jgi:hypothetical protein
MAGSRIERQASLWLSTPLLERELALLERVTGFGAALELDRDLCRVV